MRTSFYKLIFCLGIIFLTSCSVNHNFTKICGDYESNELMLYKTVKLNMDSTFVYEMVGDMYASPQACDGVWKIRNNTIILIRESDNDRFKKKYKFKITGDSLSREMFVYTKMTK